MGSLNSTGSGSIVTESNPTWAVDDNIDMNMSNAALTSSYFVGSEIRIQQYHTSSLEMANPASATLTTLIPQATTGSIFMVGSGSESWLVFKDIKGVWRTMTASIAA